jgi:hypothetical protein
MADEPNATPTTAPRAPGRSGFTRSAPAPAAADRTTGGSGVQRSHLRDRKNWLKSRKRNGRTWAQRKADSTTYCPSVAKRG